MRLKTRNSADDSGGGGHRRGHLSSLFVLLTSTLMIRNT